jgi:hypothetical protein
MFPNVWFWMSDVTMKLHRSFKSNKRNTLVHIALQFYFFIIKRLFILTFMHCLFEPNNGFGWWLVWLTLPQGKPDITSSWLMVDGPTEKKNQRREVSEIDMVRPERTENGRFSSLAFRCWACIGRADCDWWTEGEGRGRRREGKLWVGEERRGKPSSNSRQ